MRGRGNPEYAMNPSVSQASRNITKRVGGCEFELGDEIITNGMQVASLGDSCRNLAKCDNAAYDENRDQRCMRVHVIHFTVVGGTIWCEWRNKKWRALYEVYDDV